MGHGMYSALRKVRVTSLEAAEFNAMSDTTVLPYQYDLLETTTLYKAACIQILGGRHIRYPRRQGPFHLAVDAV